MSWLVSYPCGTMRANSRLSGGGDGADISRWEVPMDRRSALGLLPVVIVLFVSGCTGSVPTSPPATSLLRATPTPRYTLPAATRDPKCLPPCFRGIVPGRTTLTETLAILNISVNQIKSGQFQWESAQSRRYNFVLFDRGIVNSIVIVSNEQDTFQDIVRMHGEPEAVVTGSPGGGTAWEIIVMAYPSRGLAYLGNVLPSEDEPPRHFVAEPDTRVTDQIYFMPGTAADLAKLYAWKGPACALVSVEQWRGFGVSYSAAQ